MIRVEARVNGCDWFEVRRFQKKEWADTYAEGYCDGFVKAINGRWVLVDIRLIDEATSPQPGG